MVIASQGVVSNCPMVAAPGLSEMMRDMGANTGTGDALAEYQRGSSFLLSTPRRTLLTNGTVAEVAATSATGDALPGQARAALRGAREAGQAEPVLVGAVPFRDDRAARLVVPERVSWSASLADTAAAAHGAFPVRATNVESWPQRGGYNDGVRRALDRFDERGLAKVVLARTLRVRLSEPVDVPRLLGNLAHNDPTAYVFAVDLPPESGVGHAADRTLVGASPELLVRRSGMTVTANPLAGSLPRSTDPAVDRERARTLRESAKDANEHWLVVRAVAEALREYCTTVEVEPTPSLTKTATMWHLSTSVTGHLADAATSSLRLATALHPTPAICGVPAGSAGELIDELEPFDRGFYSGMVGWCDEAGDGEWAITLRCAEVGRQELRLFAGAGIVPGSDPDSEFAETAAKFNTMLHAIGIDGAQLRPGAA